MPHFVEMQNLSQALYLVSRSLSLSLLSLSLSLSLSLALSLLALFAETPF